MKNIAICLTLLACLSCGPQDAPSTELTPPTDLREALLGTWEIIELRVNSPTYLGEDTTVVQHIQEADWGPIFGVKPARTTYTKDEKLRREHFFRDGKLADVTHGLWRVNGDSLFVIEPSITFNYLPEITGEKLSLTGRVDWDRDGESDDDYYGLFRLVSRTQ